MKIIKTASGKKIKLSKKEWESIGKKAGWMKKASDWKTMDNKSEIDGIDTWWIGDMEEYIEACKDDMGNVTYEIVFSGRSPNKVFSDLELAKKWYEINMMQEGEVGMG